jgi:hypothetical protein
MATLHASIDSSNKVISKHQCSHERSTVISTNKNELKKNKHDQQPQPSIMFEQEMIRTLSTLRTSTVDAPSKR